MLAEKGDSVKKASEYRQHAEECRALARRMPDGDPRDQLLRMAETWERLAQARAAAHSRVPDEVPREAPAE